MELTKETMQSLVQRSLAEISDPVIQDRISNLLVEPRYEDREWDYGEIGETYPCWIVLEHPDSNTAIAYCESGFGPIYPWGLLFISGEYLSMGMDSSWFVSLEDAFRHTRAWDGENPHGYEVL